MTRHDVNSNDSAVSVHSSSTPTAAVPSRVSPPSHHFKLEELRLADGPWLAWRIIRWLLREVGVRDRRIDELERELRAANERLRQENNEQQELIVQLRSKSETDPLSGLLRRESYEDSFTHLASTLIRPLLARILELEEQNNRYKQNEKLKERNRDLIERAITECMARFNTRLAFQYCGEQAFATARRRGRHLSLVIVADLATHEFREVFRRCKRADDSAFCWDDDKFVILLPKTDASGAELFIERLLAGARSMHVETPRDFAALGCTAASASYPSTPFESVEGMFDAANRAVMQQKERRYLALSQVTGMEPTAISEQCR